MADLLPTIGRSFASDWIASPSRVRITTRLGAKLVRSGAGIARVWTRGGSAPWSGAGPYDYKRGSTRMTASSPASRSETTSINVPEEEAERERSIAKAA